MYILHIYIYYSKNRQRYIYIVHIYICCLYIFIYNNYIYICIYIYIYIYIIFKEQTKKIQFTYYSEFHVTKLQLNRLHKTLRNQISVMISLMTL